MTTESLGEEPIRTLGAEPGAPERPEPGNPTTKPPSLAIEDIDEDLGADPGLGDPGQQTTDLDAVRADLDKDVDHEPCTLPVPMRPRFKLRFSSELDEPVLEKWTKAARDRKAVTGVRELELSLRILSNQNIAILYDDKVVTEAGHPLTVAHRAFQEMLHVGRAFDAVRKLFGKDGHVLAAGNEVLDACGYGITLSEALEDPTRR